MKICVTSQGNTLESEVDPRFGRCAYFIIGDPNTMDFEVFDNSHAGSSGGAGIQSGQLVSEKGIQAVLTGNVGPNAFKTLQAAGIDIFCNVSGKIADAIKRYKNGEFKAVGGATASSHFGMKSGA